MIRYSDVLVDRGHLEVRPHDFYRDLFSQTELYRHYGRDLWFPLVLSEGGADGGGTWRSKLNLDAVLDVSEGRSDAYLAPCTFFHGRLGRKWAMELVAFVLDIDRGDPALLGRALDDWWPNGKVLVPTYVVCSGNGVHLYYALAYPVEFRRMWERELRMVNRWLYDQYQGEFSLGERDYHGLTQPYRVVGSLVKDSEASTAAFSVGQPYLIEELASAAGIGSKFAVGPFDGGPITGEKRERYEREAARRAAGGKPSKRTGWNPGFYAWLARRERDRSSLYGEFGHRYKQVQALAVAAVKDRVPKEQLRSDVRDLHRRWNECAARNGHPRIQWSECEKAMRIYDQGGDTRKYPKWWLEELCGFEYGTQKRNGRTQREHLEDVHEFRRTRTVLKLQRYLREHPDSTQVQAERELGVTRKTLRKYWPQACMLAGIEDTRTGNHDPGKARR